MRWPWKTRSEPSPVSTGEDQPAQDGTGAAVVDTDGDQGCTDGDECHFIGIVRTPKEHAVRLREYLGEALAGRSLYVGQLEDLYQDMCNEIGWVPCRWLPVGRELKKLEGVRKGKVWLNGKRLTVYGFGPPAETTKVSTIRSRAAGG